MSTQKQRLFRIYGIVQGVGFRPFVSRLARRLSVCGDVANRGSFVEIHAAAEEETLAQFRAALENEAPPRSAILKIDDKPWAVDETSVPAGFSIIESARERGDIFVSPDIATCPLCESELYQPDNRRYLHPFINCTACGPRVTIMDSMPYDRERTSMAGFPLCPECAGEYHSPQSRRYDAQPVCCNQCGPRLYTLGDTPLHDRDALTATRRTLINGGIAAIKGIGGFHLACDATNDAAVRRLRKLKHRPAKPLAVMMADLGQIRTQCHLPSGLEEIITGHQKPIVLLRRRSDSTLPDSVAPGNPTVGVMLPYAPVQMLLFRCDDELDALMPQCLVMTSGNAAGAPICRDDTNALTELAGFCDIILSHDRPIRLRADDSVMEHFEGRPYMIRRSRGYAPLPVMLSGNWRGEVLGIGGELKNTFCPAKDNLCYPSPYIGDMADLRSVNALRASVQRLNTLLEIRPRLIACDLHPLYNTSAIAREMGLPVLPVQHHWAHILACMAENDALDEEVLGVAYDGTGYGPDNTIWGGEILQANVRSFRRVAELESFLLPGGDAAAREGWRCALSLLCTNDTPLTAAETLTATLGLCTPAQLHMVRTMCERHLNAVPTTSAGRLFDAAAATLGLVRSSTFEGEAAMALQFAAMRTASYPGLPVPPLGGTAGHPVIPSRALLRQLADGRREGLPAETLAHHFHHALCELTAAALCRLREHTGLNTVALSGGVFQNTLLLQLLAGILRERGFRLLLHSMIPPNDGGIGLGQAAAALASLNR